MSTDIQGLILLNQKIGFHDIYLVVDKIAAIEEYKVAFSESQIDCIIHLVGGEKIIITNKTAAEINEDIKNLCEAHRELKGES